jgi:hypothetical protein
MNHQQNNLLRLRNKYAVRFGEQDPLVLELKKEIIELQLRQREHVVHRSMLFERNVKELEFVQTI